MLLVGIGCAADKKTLPVAGDFVGRYEVEYTDAWWTEAEKHGSPRPEDPSSVPPYVMILREDGSWLRRMGDPAPGDPQLEMWSSKGRTWRYLGEDKLEFRTTYDNGREDRTRIGRIDGADIVLSEHERWKRVR